MICARFLPIAMTLLVFFASTDTFAQRSATKTTLPDISVPPIGSELDGGNRLNPGNFTEFQIQNSYLGDKVRLQYQIALIQKLIDFQKQVLDVQKAYDNLGITYNSPAPSRRICAQIPVNALCYNAYPNLFPDIEETLSARKKEVLDQAIDKMTNKTGFDAVRANARPEGGLAGARQAMEEQQANNDSSSRQKDEKLAPRTNFEWVEIFCLSGDCQGVMTDRRDEEIRLTVSVGDMLPDGAEITKIAPGRMEAMKNGDLIVVKPAPLVRRAEEDEAPSGPLADVFNLPPRGSTGNPIKERNERQSRDLEDLPPLPEEDPNSPPPSNNDQDNQGLGQTGLF